MVASFFNNDELKVGPSNLKERNVTNNNKKEKQTPKIQNKNKLVQEIYFNQNVKDKLKKIFILDEVVKYVGETLEKKVQKKQYVNARDIVTISFAHFLIEDFEETFETFPCIILPDHQAYFSFVNNHARYYSFYKKENYSIDLIDIIQFAYDFTFVEAVEILMGEHYHAYSEIDQQLKEFLKLSNEIQILRNTGVLYKEIYDQHFKQANFTFQVFNPSNVTFFIDLPKIQLDTRLAKNTIQNQLQLFINLGLLKKMTFDELNEGQQELIRNYNLRAEKRKVMNYYQLPPLTSETLKEIKKINNIFNNSYMKMKDLYNKDLNIRLTYNELEERIKQYIKKKTDKGHAFNQQTIINRFRLEADVLLYFRENKQNFVCFDNVVYRKPTKQEIKEYKLKNSSFIYIQKA